MVHISRVGVVYCITEGVWFSKISINACIVDGVVDMLDLKVKDCGSHRWVVVLSHSVLYFSGSKVAVT